jgi:hypothetical protein
MTRTPVAASATSSEVADRTAALWKERLALTSVIVRCADRRRRELGGGSHVGPRVLSPRYAQSRGSARKCGGPFARF